MERKELIESIENTLSIEAHEIARLKEYVDKAVLVSIVETISNCKGKVVVTSCGTSAAAGKKIVHSLSVINIPSVFLVPSDAVHGSLGIVKEEDVVIFISKGGNTSEITCYLENVKQKSAKMIAVTENVNSLIAQYADILLNIKVEREPDEFNMLATASTLSVIAAFDAICIAIMEYNNFTLETFALNHPQGAVGDRLLDK
ncbi:KpsF/GutQ family sugar-phosphate isomerase [Enterococcus faecium]|uniref:KpsF/GutQ family sugar-phosphate isomerase n=1 Tax=Enterococcus faecium TaxID=1352 RepID=UPI001106954A|nr:SIS domain-containing protein [Enterococcus faecium]